MKHNSIVLTWLVTAAMIIAGITGCTKFGNGFLEKPPSVDVTKDTIFSSLDYAQRFLWGAYATLPYGLPTNTDPASGFSLNGDVLESLTDLNQCNLSWASGMSVYYSGQYSAATEDISLSWANGTKYVFTAKGRNWKGIRAGYIFIDNIGTVPGVDPNLAKQLKAEARMIIATQYIDMYRNMGGVPWVNHAYTVTENTDLPRLTSRATLDSIVAVIDKAIPDLPWTVQDPSNWDGRFTKAAAMGLKARVLLFGASPLFNSAAAYLAGEASEKKLVWHGGYDPDMWKKAADAAKDLITNVESKGGYALVKTGNPRKDFQTAYFVRGNGELLLSTRYIYKPTSFFDANYYFYQIAAYYGVGGPTENYVEMFPMANGLPITDPASGYDPQDPLKNRDPRLYETVLVNGDYFMGRTAELWIGGIDRPTADAANCATGFGLRKFLLERDPATSGGAITQWPLLRLAEIYLSYAEAQNEVNNGPDAEAYRCVNIVRNRVGLGDLTPGLSKDQFREAVLTERACEFGYEDVRWYDLIRWKRDFEFTKTLHGLNIQKNGNSYTYSLFNLPPRYWKNTWSPKWYLSAFPPGEINKGYGLIQNPGWQ